MAKFVLTDALIDVDENDISSHVSSVSIDPEAEEVDATGMSADGWREFLVGLKDATIALTVQQDFDDAGSVGINSIFWPAFVSGDTVEVKIRPTSAAISATNPEFSMEARVLAFSPLSGSVGELSTTDINLRNANQARGVEMDDGSV